jgi:hypothetical protein
MKRLLQALGVIAVCLILILVVLRFTGFGPHARTPGLWLKGNVVTTPVTDWSFTDNIPVIQIQTQSPYFLPQLQWPALLGFCLSRGYRSYLE